MKKTKLITSLCLLIISIACLTFGVFSAIKTTFTASGTVTFNAYKVDTDIRMSISGTKEPIADYYASTNPSRGNHIDRTYSYSSSIVFNDMSKGLSDIDFSFDEFSGTNKIRIDFSIGNFSGFNIIIKSNITGDAVNYLDITTTGQLILQTEYDVDNCVTQKGFYIEFSPKDADTKIEGKSINIDLSMEAFTKFELTTYDSPAIKELTENKVVVDLMQTGSDSEDGGFAITFIDHKSRNYSIGFDYTIADYEGSWDNTNVCWTPYFPVKYNGDKSGYSTLPHGGVDCYCIDYFAYDEDFSAGSESGVDLIFVIFIKKAAFEKFDMTITF